MSEEQASDSSPFGACPPPIPPAGGVESWKVSPLYDLTRATIPFRLEEWAKSRPLCPFDFRFDMCVMKIRFHCPAGHPLSVPHGLVGKRVRCAHCKQIARVPASSTRAMTAEGHAKPVAAPKPLPPPKPSSKSLPEPLPKPARPRPKRRPAAAPSTEAETPQRSLPKLKSMLALLLKSELVSKLNPKRNRPSHQKPAQERAKKPTSSRWSDTMPELPPEKLPIAKGSEPSDKAATATADRQQKAEPEPSESKTDKPRSRWSGRKSRRDRKRAKGSADVAAATTGSKDLEPTAPPLPKPRVAKRKRAVRRPTVMPPDVCRPDEGRLATVKWLALILAVVVLFSTGPVFVRMHWNLQTAPGWARIVVLMAVLQGVYIAWMLNHPDWASVWVVMLVFAIVASIYGTATAMVLATPLEKPMLLGMEEVRHTATAWCGAVLSAMTLATYLCGRTSAKWRRIFELETAGKGRSAR